MVWFSVLFGWNNIRAIMFHLLFQKKNKVLLVFIVPAAILMIITLVNMKMGKG